MFYKCLMCFVFVALPIECLFKGESCTADHRLGTCKQLSKCTHLMNEIRHCGTPMPPHMRDKLKRLGCGFDYDEPLVCCDSSSNTAYTERPFSGDSWGSHEYGKEDRYDKGPHYDADQNDWTTKPSSNTWGSGGTHGRDPWGSSGSNTWGSSGSNTWGSGGNQDPYNTGGGKDPYANNGGGNKDDRNNNNKWDSNKNTVDNSIERIPDVRNHRNLDILPIECGAIEGERIFGGNRTKLFEMPWMVLLSYDSARGTKLSCGGSLISEWYVLTAAHCISFLGTKLKLRSVILGEYDVRRDPDCERMEGELFCAPKVRNVAVDTVIPHPDYSPQRLGDDIGLIRLAEPADFTLDSMKPICLPTSPELQSENLEGLNGVVAGWGATEDGLQSPVLLSVDLPIISNRDCQALYNGSPRIDKSQLCAGGIRDKDSCGGDSGGPLLYPGRTRAGAGVRYVQRGIVSYGSKRCGLGGFPGVYTRVANYMDWILDNIR
nr:phenoloxidase-activating factor 3-like isoform X1 [Maniola hyperantus]